MKKRMMSILLAVVCIFSIGLTGVQWEGRKERGEKRSNNFKDWGITKCDRSCSCYGRQFRKGRIQIRSSSI